MRKGQRILLLIFMFCFVGFTQNVKNNFSFFVKGSVKSKENRMPISGVAVTTSSGGYATTNVLGEFKIKGAIGDELRFEHNKFAAITYLIKNSEELDVLVQDYVPIDSKPHKTTFKKSSSQYQTYLDSAYYFKKINIEKSIDFITKAIIKLGPNGNKNQLAKSYTILGEIYEYYKQYDLAIRSYKEALDVEKSIKTELLLGKSYILNKEFKNAETIFSILLKKPEIELLEKVEIYEGMGDAHKGLGYTNRSLENYNKGLSLAKGISILPKITDLNSKIADTYAADNQLEEAEMYYENSIELSIQQQPQRAVQEKEKVADFYNQNSLYDKEIKLRKKSLEDFQQLNKKSVRLPKTSQTTMASDSISAQRIKYKIGNALLSQQKYVQAIPFLEESIKEAGDNDDLIVQKDATRKLSEVYEYQGDFSKAYETYQKYVAMVDTLYIRKEQEISRAVRFNKDIASKQNRISGLEKERELYQSKYDLAMTSEKLVEGQKWLIYSLILVILLLGLTTYFFYRSNRQQKLANNLLALKSLRSQMNPHFIFNALNSVNNYISKNDERSANRYLSDFSTLMRAVLENSEEDFIPLSKELELLELYTKLEHSRFSDKFDYEIHIEEQIDVAAFEIPPMLLQPYIENAIWHGLRYKDEKGFLKIDLKKKGESTIQIIITDDGIGRQKSVALKTSNQKKQRSKGMGNIKKRIDILNDMYKDKVAVFISDYQIDGSGTKVIFTLKREK